jgi:phosphodiesterase/alkaline phosphatase D-like protein
MRHSKRSSGTAAAIIAAAALLAASCGNSLLSKPLLSCALSDTPTTTPGSATASIAFRTSQDARCQIEYGTSAGSLSSASIIESSLAAAHSYVLSGLGSSTLYYYRVRMLDSSGAETRSPLYSFTTQAGTGAATVTVGPTATPGETSCVVSFTTSEDASAVIEYGKASGSYASSTIIEPSAVPSHSISISGLAPSTVYFYRIRMYSTTSVMSLSAESSFTTTADTGAAAVLSAPVASVTETTATIPFNTTVNARCVVEYGTSSGTYSSATVLEAASAPSHSIAIASLDPDTLYYYRIRMQSATQTTLSAEYNFATSDGAAVTVVNETPVMLACAVAFTTDIAARCSIEYGTAPGSYASATAQEAAAAPGHSIALSGLTPSTTYYYRIRMTSAAGSVTTSSAYSFATTDYIAGLGSVSAITPATGLASLTVTWTSTSAYAATLVYGTSSGRYSGSSTESSATVSHSIALTGLATGTTYYYRIQDGAAYSSTERTAATAAASAPTLAQKIRGIWLIGGLTADIGTAISQVDLFDPVSNAFYPAVTSLPTAVSFMGAESIRISSTDHRIYVIGGFNSSGAAQQRIQWYSIENDAWTTDTTTITAARANIMAVRLYDRIYIMGGNTGAHSAWSSSATTYSLQPSTGAWSQLSTTIPVTSSDRFLFAFGDVLYFIGGRTAVTTVVSANDGYSISGNALTTNGAEIAFPSIRTGVAGALWTPSSGAVAARVITFGGFTAVTGTGSLIGYSTGTIANGTMLANPAVQYLNYPFTAPSAWTAAVNFPTAVTGFAAAAIASDGTNDVYYVFGGTASIARTTGVTAAAGTTSVNSLVLNSSMSNSWNAVSPPAMPVGRWGHAAVSIQHD